MANSRNTINQRIALEGGDEIISMLKGMGKEGEAAAKKLENAFAQVKVSQGLNAQFAKIKQTFSDLQTSAGKVGKKFGEFTKSIGDVGAAFKSTVGKITLYTGALAGAATAGGLFVKNQLDSLGELNDLAASLGVTTDQLQALQFAGAQAGVEGNDFLKTISSLSETMQELQSGTDKSAVGMGKIGTEFKDVGDAIIKIHRGIPLVSDDMKKNGDEASKMSDKAKALQDVLNRVGIPAGRKLVPVDVLKTVADAFSKMEDGAKKTQLAIDIFGPKLGPRLIPFLNQGGQAIDNYEKKLNQLQGMLSKELIAAGDQAGDQLDLLTLLMGRYAQKFAGYMAPAIIQASDKIFSTIQQNSGKIDGWLRSTSETIGQVVLDVTTLLTGGPDANVQNKWLIDFRDGFLSVKKAVVDLFEKTLIPAFNKVRELAGPVAEQINKLFGTNLTGDQLLIGAAIFQLVGGFKLLFSILNVGITAFTLFTSTVGLLGTSLKLVVQSLSFLGTALTGGIRLFGLLGAFLGPAGLIALGVVALGVAIWYFWDDIVAGAKATFEFLKKAFSAAWEGIKTVTASAWEGIKTVFSDTWAGIKEVARTELAALATVMSDTWEGMKTVAATAWSGLTTVFSDTWEGMKTIAGDARNGLITVASETWTGITNTVTMARDGLFLAASTTWGAIKEAASGVAATLGPIWDGAVAYAKQAFSAVATTVVEAWSGAKQNIVDAAQAIQDAISTAVNIAGDVAGATDIANKLVQPFIDARNRIAEVVRTYGDVAREGFNSVSGAINNLAADINRQINAILTNLRRAIAEARRLRASAAASSSSRTVSKAAGGHIIGAGTSTSDSIPAWLSNGEFVIRAAAVRKYGVGFFKMLNGMTANFKKNGLPAFATGGFVNASVGAIAPVALSAGAVRSGFTLVIGGETFSGLSGPSDTIMLLEQAVKTSKIRSTGRKHPYA